MPQRRSLAYLFGLIGLVVAPSVASLVWYAFSRNPELRPLAITKQALAAYNGGSEGLEIVAVVDWGSESGGEIARRHFARDLATSFAAKGVEVRVSFRDSEAGLRVTYQVGRTRLGPYNAARAAEGVNAAVAAYKMH